MEYNEIDPMSAFNLSMLALDFQLTPEHAAHIRKTDPRPLPCFAIYAVEGDKVLGQMGIFRLPMISTEGRQDVGGIWAVSTHPQHAGSGIATLLLKEAHARMREVGLRFSTLGTNRYRVAYKLYRQLGYQDAGVWATALASWETAHQPTRLRARAPGPDGFKLVDQIFSNAGNNYLGFAWRHTPFAVLRDKVEIENIWILCENKHPVGYALAHLDNAILNISSLLLSRDVDVTEAVAAVVTEMKTAYVKVKISRPVEIASLSRAGYRVTNPNWDAFMVKPLTPDATMKDARQLFGIGTDRFLISWLDIT
jgi:GNAT superfamily N-acetyltransferase